MSTSPGLEWKESAIDSHIRQYPLATMAHILERLRKEFEVSGSLSTVRLDRLKIMQQKLNQLVDSITLSGSSRDMNFTDKKRNR